jgi:hypothetical protein
MNFVWRAVPSFEVSVHSSVVMMDLMISCADLSSLVNQFTYYFNLAQFTHKRSPLSEESRSSSAIIFICQKNPVILVEPQRSDSFKLLVIHVRLGILRLL